MLHAHKRYTAHKQEMFPHPIFITLSALSALDPESSKIRLALLSSMLARQAGSLLRALAIIL
jgi:hypothetical protein